MKAPESHVPDATKGPNRNQSSRSFEHHGEYSATRVKNIFTCCLTFVFFGVPDFL